MDALILGRIQFAANISFHILFPSITIALGWMLVYFKLRYNSSRDQAWMDAYQFWVKVFALSFAMGVVSGITMSFQFGTNWPGFMGRVGNIAGPLLAYEVLTAFFLEAVFLGIMLFGFSKVPGWLHTFATALVAAATTLSAFWIIVLISWMHTPVGYEMRDNVAHATDWLAIIFSPSMSYRLAHMLLASGLTAAFLVAGISAYRWQRNDRSLSVRYALKAAILLAAILMPIQTYVGDLHGLNTLQYQPMKVAAMEANWETKSNVPLVLFAVPDEETRSNRLEISIPSGASLILKHDVDGVIPGLNEAPDGVHPPVAPVFFAFRIMVGVGVLMLLVSWTALVQWYRRRELTPLLTKALIGMTFAGWVATLSGWYVTEIGRQPWLVTGILRTDEAASSVAAPMIGITLAAYLILYAVLLAAYVATLFLLARKGATPKSIDTGPSIHATAFVPAE